jgi:AI-2 transport system ATP-binding protein
MIVYEMNIFSNHETFVKIFCKRFKSELKYMVVNKLKSEEHTPLLEIKEMYKTFSGNPVLRGVNLSLRQGEVHAIVGGNGAGKSTLMKIITGLYKPDSGMIQIKGKQVSFSSTHDAHLHGNYLVPQEPLIFPNMSVEENIMIGLSGKKSTLKEKLKNIIEQLGWKLKMQSKALNLSIAERQLVEIIRGLIREAEILILDEPTSTLTFGEIDSLFQNIKHLTSKGIGVFYITHRFSEIFTLAHTVSVLRDGVISDHGSIHEFSYERLLSGIRPEKSTKNHPDLKERSRSDSSSTVVKHLDTPILEIRGMVGERFHNISFTLHSGEVLGMAGVVGAGRTEIAEALFGLTAINQGSIFFDGKDITNQSIQQRINQGLVYVPEDRHSHGLFSIASIKNNISSTLLHRLSKIFLPFQKEKRLAAKYISELKVKTTSIHQELKDLSGGNQQKVVLSKYLAVKPKVIILDEPTRGIDAFARRDIYRLINLMKNDGLAVLLISSDMEEIEKLSDRVMVVHEGNIIKVLEKSEINVDAITSAAFGVKQEVKI